MEDRSSARRIALAFVLAIPSTAALACSPSAGDPATTGASASSGCEAEPPAPRAPEVEVTPIPPDASAPAAAPSSGDAVATETECNPCDDDVAEGNAEGIALVRRIVDDPTALAGAIDPQRGLVVARYEEATPGRAAVHVNHRICGAPSRARVAEARTILRDALERSTPEEEWDCDAAQCSIPPMEYVPAVTIRFAHDAQGRLVIEAITSTSEALLGEDEIAAGNTYVQAALDRARATPCRPASR